MAVIHELAEIGLTSMMYKHDTMIDMYNVHDQGRDLHNKYSELQKHD